MSEKRSLKFLVLSGGGIRGAAHVGVIRALEERGFVPDAILGVSIGAIVGAGYAALKDAHLLWDYSMKFCKMYRHFFRFFPFNFISSSSTKSKPGKFFAKMSCFYITRKQYMMFTKIYFKILKKYFGKLHFEDLKIKFYCISTDLNTGKIVLHSSGGLFKALLASMAIPGVFPPVKSGNTVAVDGGTLNNLPADIAKNLGANYVVAVDLSKIETSLVIPETSNTILNILNSICENKMLSFLRREADFIIYPPIEEINDVSNCFEVMENAYKYTLNLALPGELFK
ncbi:patatin-like phospholipase family protein [Thermosipho ferrireducens]|uniref:Patatin-like phospholipase family protein n=1 Tax=Thermosipho ferrireducens TaxID=2571116 RepID=A0ABX7S789_9BACT|nr:patatin-like phospholipase family protein [Thermosipho ferrireducens]QTA37778.1 patatin-like phospholipase family protein [Thermosipho ferrireducens]